MPNPNGNHVYTADQWSEFKHLFVEKEWSARQISKHFNGRPHENTISNRAKKKDRNGKTWADYRADRFENLYEQLTPQNQMQKIMERIDSMLNKPAGDDAKWADAIYKLNLTMQKLVDKDFQVPMFYYFAEQFVSFSKEHYPELVSQEFIEAVRSFKNHVRARLTNEL